MSVTTGAIYPLTWNLSLVINRNFILFLSDGLDEALFPSLIAFEFGAGEDDRSFCL